MSEHDTPSTSATAAGRPESAPYATPWEVQDPADCHFYHTLDIPGLGVMPGHVDLRPNAGAYLGDVPVAGRRVLEIGPASGFLTFHMEEAGAREVVALEIGADVVWDMVPRPDLDMAAIRRDRAEHLRRIKRGFWLAHRARGSRARVVYGDAAAPPAGLGRFDLAVLGGVLLHCRDPLAVLDACAGMVDEAIVITEQEMPGLRDSADYPIKWLVPARDNRTWDVWWRFTPGFFAQALPLLGFPEVTVSRHEQLSRGTLYPHFTVVGRRA